jgi:beta-lactamase regulating signal transducer with metallopeptidase domain
MLIRLLVGWWGVTRIAAAGRLALSERLAIAHNRHITVRESLAIRVPVTVGVIRCTVLLPSGWSAWSHEKLRAVLAHEMAHVSRRDPLVAFIAHLNRCLFWFHPLSWFLERTVAATAEQAADEEAMVVLGDRRAYAEILLEMARAVAPGGGRVAWLGVGIDGSGLLK